MTCKAQNLNISLHCYVKFITMHPVKSGSVFLNCNKMLPVTMVLETPSSYPKTPANQQEERIGETLKPVILVL